MPTSKNRYEALIAAIFHANYKTGQVSVAFSRDEITRHAKILRIHVPKNLGDVIYSFRYRVELPESIRRLSPPGKHWIIRPAGRSKYAFVATSQDRIQPSAHLATIKVPDATPGLIAMYALSDEQALLAKIRYNRLLDVFSGTACYSLQSHLRSTAPGLGQVEIDEVYVGLDRSGAHFVFPVQAKGGNDKIGIVQIEQDIALCRAKFPNPTCRPIAAQFLKGNVIALFEFVEQDKSLRVLHERHYQLVSPDEVTPEDLKRYRTLLHA